MRRVKLNNYVSFPHKLSMAKYIRNSSAALKEPVKYKKPDTETETETQIESEEQPAT